MFMWKMTLTYLFLGLGAGEPTQKSRLRSSPKPTSTDTGATCWESHAQGKEVSALQIPSAKASFIGSSAVFFGLVQLTKLNQRIQETIFRLKGSPSSYFPLSNPRCSLSFETHRYLESFSLTPMSYFLTQLPLQRSSVTWVPPQTLWLPGFLPSPWKVLETTRSLEPAWSWLSKYHWEVGWPGAHPFISASSSCSFCPEGKVEPIHRNVLGISRHNEYNPPGMASGSLGKFHKDDYLLFAFLHGLPLFLYPKKTYWWVQVRNKPYWGLSTPAWRFPYANLAHSEFCFDWKSLGSRPCHS